MPGKHEPGAVSPGPHRGETCSCPKTLVPIAAGSPLTATRPAEIRASALRREGAAPARARKAWSRTTILQPGDLFGPALRPELRRMHRGVRGRGRALLRRRASRVVGSPAGSRRLRRRRTPPSRPGVTANQDSHGRLRPRLAGRDPRGYARRRRSSRPGWPRSLRGSAAPCTGRRRAPRGRRWRGARGGTLPGKSSTAGAQDGFVES